MDKINYNQKWQDWDDVMRYGATIRHKQRIIREILSSLRFDSVLDVGCGVGNNLLNAINHRGVYSSVGIDISETVLKKARRALPASEFQVCDIEQESLPCKFDLVLCCDVLEHLDHDITALHNMRRMCKGRILISTLVGKMLPFEKECGHVRRYSPDELEYKLSLARFRIEKVVRWGFPFFSPLYLSLLNRVPNSVNDGKFGVGRKVVSQLLYRLFYLNLYWGDYVFIVGRAI